MEKKVKIILGIVITTIAIGLSIHWYDWKLALIIMLAITGNNIERTGNKLK